MIGKPAMDVDGSRRPGVSPDSQIAQLLDEFTDQLNAGAQPDVEEFLKQHSELAATLRPVLETLQSVFDISQSGESPLDSLHSDATSDSEKRLGDFRILHELGRGGMGVVYEAEQISMGGRKVALKVLPFAAMVDEKRLQRFRNEVRAAASLDHPNIVSVYSVGEERGVHFYAMQLIRGQSLASLIEQLRDLRMQQHPLSAAPLSAVLSASGNGQPTSTGYDATQEFQSGSAEQTAPTPVELGTSSPNSDTVPGVQGLVSTKGNPRRSEYYQSVAELGIQAAEALDHAHQQGVVHRDIKPANLMIDAKCKLYITDFGLAQMEENVGITMTGDIIGTLRYMSPEQALGSRVAINHRADIYALGISLYELLITEPAFDGENRAALLKQIAFQEPRRLRQIDRSIPHDLETIIHKAIAKNPDERYDSAQQLADDLRAFHDNQPITARPPSIVDRSRKWTYRNQGLVLATAIVMILAISGLAISNSMIASQRNAARTEAERADREAAAAKSEAAVSAAVIEFINTDLLGSANPFAEPNRDMKVREVLNRAVQNVETRFKDQPLVAAAIQRTLGNTFLDLGEYAQAELSLKSAQKLYRQHLGIDHVDALLIDVDVAGVYTALGLREQASELYQSLLERSSSTRGAEDAITLKVRSFIAKIMNAEGRSREAEQLAREVLEIQRRVLGFDNRDTLNTVNELAIAIVCQDRSSEAEQLYRESLDIQRRVRGLEHPSTLGYMSNLALAINDQGRFGEAEELFLEVLETQRRVMGPEHPDSLGTMHNLAEVMFNAGRYAEAEQLNREVLEIRRRALGPEHIKTLGTMHNLATAINSQGRSLEAEKLLREVLEIQRRVLGYDHPHTLNSLQSLAWLIGWTRSTEAAELYRAGLDTRRRVFGVDHPFTLEGVKLVANTALSFSWHLSSDADPTLRDPQLAVEFGREATQLQPDFGEHWSNLGAAYYRSGQWREAAESFKTADELIEGGDLSGRMFLAMTHWQLGEKHIARQRYAEGAAWIEANRRSDANQLRFRAEAEELMGISELERNEHIARHYSHVDMSDAKELLARGLWSQSRGKDEAAILDLTAAIELDPNSTNFVLWRARGVSLSKLGKLQEALTDLCMANKLNPIATGPLSQRGLVYQKLGKLDLALADFSKSIELKPTQVSERQNYFHRAGIYRELKEFDLALKDCETAIAIDPDNDTSVFRRSTAFALRGDILAEDLQRYREAIEEYSRAIELDPKNTTYSEKRAQALEKLGDAQPARSDHTEALFLQPTLVPTTTSS